MFNNLVVPWATSSQHSAGLVSWNSRALLHHLDSLRLQKRQLLTKLQTQYSVLALQEIHGNYDRLKAFDFHLDTRFHVFASFCRDAADETLSKKMKVVSS